MPAIVAEHSDDGYLAVYKQELRTREYFAISFDNHACVKFGAYGLEGRAQFVIDGAIDCLAGMFAIAGELVCVVGEVMVVGNIGCCVESGKCLQCAWESGKKICLEQGFIPLLVVCD